MTSVVPTLQGSNGYAEKCSRRVSRNTLIQTGLRLEPKILEKLRSGRGVSEEIRDRLQRAFAEDELNFVTRELRDGIANIAKLLRQDFGTEWHTSRAAHEAFAAALAQRIAAYAPPAEAPIDADSEILGAPDIIGRMRERDDRGLHTSRYRYLTALLKAKSGATD
jgi:hypothetical protein